MGRLSGKHLAECGVAGGDVLIETGTMDGIGTRHVAKLFRQIHTIEADRRLHDAARKLLAGYPNVRCHYGDSPRLLAKVIDPKRETVFYLDAHYVPGLGEPPSAGQCALRAELAIIAAFRWRVPPVIIIDDARMFTWYFKSKRFLASRDKTHYNPADWPTLAEIQEQLHGYEIKPAGRMLAARRVA